MGIYVWSVIRTIGRNFCRWVELSAKLVKRLGHEYIVLHAKDLISWPILTKYCRQKNLCSNIVHYKIWKKVFKLVQILPLKGFNRSTGLWITTWITANTLLLKNQWISTKDQLSEYFTDFFGLYFHSCVPKLFLINIENVWSKLDVLIFLCSIPLIMITLRMGFIFISKHLTSVFL